MQIPYKIKKTNTLKSEKQGRPLTFLGTGEEIHLILLKVQPSLEVCFPELWVPGETVSTELGIRRHDLLAVAGHGLITPTTLSTVQDLLAVAGHCSIPRPLPQQFRTCWL